MKVNMRAAAVLWLGLGEVGGKEAPPEGVAVRVNVPGASAPASDAVEHSAWNASTGRAAEPQPAPRTDPVRLIILKLARTGSSLLGYELDDLHEDVLCAMLNDTPKEEKENGHKWVKNELLNHHYDDDVTAEDHLLRVKSYLGFPDACEEGNDWCEPRRACKSGASFYGFTLSPVKDKDNDRAEELFQKLAEYISALEPGERPFVWMHTRHNVVRQALSAYRETYMQKNDVCPGASLFHLDPALCPAAFDPIPVEPEILEQYAERRMRQTGHLERLGSRLAAAAATGFAATDTDSSVGAVLPMVDCRGPDVGCERAEGAADGPAKGVSTTYEYITGRKENVAKALADLLGQGEDGPWRQMMAPQDPFESPKSSRENTRELVENFDELLAYAEGQPAGSLWRGEWGIAAMLCDGVDPPCPGWMDESL